jgi:transcriptional regulator with XRE-family HTH domain
MPSLTEKPFGRLLAEMAQFGVTRTDLMELTGVSRNALGNKLRGETQFTLRECQLIAKLFSQSIECLFASESDGRELDERLNEYKRGRGAGA